MVSIQNISIVGLLAMVLACSKGDGSVNKASEDEEIVQLKGVALLSTSLQSTLGYEKDEDTSDPERGSLLVKYKKIFGEIEGLSIGKTYADTASGTNVMTGYFLGLSHVAGNAANQCVLSGDPACNCDTTGSAREMLKNAIPYIDFDADEQQDLVQEFADLCLANQKEAISALISSMAFAKRN